MLKILTKIFPKPKIIKKFLEPKISTEKFSKKILEPQHSPKRSLDRKSSQKIFGAKNTYK